MTDRTESGWHLDRKVPITLIVLIIFNFAGFVWVASQMDARITANEKSISEIKSVTNNLPANMATLQAQMVNIERSLARIERAIEADRQEIRRNGQ